MPSKDRLRRRVETIVFVGIYLAVILAMLGTILTHSGG